MDLNELKVLIKDNLPDILRQDETFRDTLQDILTDTFADKKETESRFDRVQRRMEQTFQESVRRWDEQQAQFQAQFAAIRSENQQRWDEQTRVNDELGAKIDQVGEKVDGLETRFDGLESETKKLREDFEAYATKSDTRWDENAQLWREQKQENESIRATIRDTEKKILRVIDTRIGALGARWGTESETTFRSALRGILSESFDVEVLNVTEFDEAGEVFGQPDQIELDIIVKNGVLIICELKSSMSKSDMHAFYRKCQFYQNRHQRQANRLIVISPMVDKLALPVAKRLNIEVFSYPEDVPPDDSP